MNEVTKQVFDLLVDETNKKDKKLKPEPPTNKPDYQLIDRHTQRDGDNTQVIELYRLQRFAVSTRVQKQNGLVINIFETYYDKKEDAQKWFKDNKRFIRPYTKEELANCTSKTEPTEETIKQKPKQDNQPNVHAYNEYGWRSILWHEIKAPKDKKDKTDALSIIISITARPYIANRFAKQTEHFFVNYIYNFGNDNLYTTDNKDHIMVRHKEYNDALKCFDERLSYKIPWHSVKLSGFRKHEKELWVGDVKNLITLLKEGKQYDK